MKARLYGTVDRPGKLVDFKVVDSLPVHGEEVIFGDPGYVWGEAEEARLDPEQHHYDEAEMYAYKFYIVPEIDVEDGEVAYVHYFAVEEA